MKSPVEIELKFQVPAEALASITGELGRASSARTIRLAAQYLDTEDRRLSRRGIAWRLRRERRTWKQTLKAAGANPLERFEHEVSRAAADFDPQEHAGTDVGDRLLTLLKKARADGLEVGVRYRTDIRRTIRTVRTRGAVVEIALDQGRVLSNGAALKVCEIEFELISGSTASMLGLVERWRKRFGLIFDPHSKAERGDRLAEGDPFPEIRKAARTRFAGDANALEALAVVVDECLAQITRNAAGLVIGDPARAVEHVHQLRVGIRRLRSALRCLQPWAPAPPPHLLDGLRILFETLGESRDSAVLGTGVAAELAELPAPPLALPPQTAGPDPVECVKSPQTQQLLLGWLTWRATLDGASASGTQEAERTAAESGASDNVSILQDQPEDHALARDAGAGFREGARRLLRRWHRRIVADHKVFESLDETELHGLRKRIKRQRYAVEFLTPLLRRARTERYLAALAVVQDRMGYLNDLFSARTQYQRLVASDPAAWFALGWLAARITEVRALVKPGLAALLALGPPSK